MTRGCRTAGAGNPQSWYAGTTHDSFNSLNGTLSRFCARSSHPVANPFQAFASLVALPIICPYVSPAHRSCRHHIAVGPWLVRCEAPFRLSWLVFSTPVIPFPGIRPGAGSYASTAVSFFTPRNPLRTDTTMRWTGMRPSSTDCASAIFGGFDDTAPTDGRSSRHGSCSWRDGCESITTALGTAVAAPTPGTVPPRTPRQRAGSSWISSGRASTSKQSRTGIVPPLSWHCARKSSARLSSTPWPTYRRGTESCSSSGSRTMRRPARSQR